MTPSRASGVEPRTAPAYDFEGAEWDDITEREKRTIVQGLYERLHYLNERYLAIEAEAALRQGTPEKLRAWKELDDIADDVRYADGNGTSEYWRGFNDGIDALVIVMKAAALPSTTEGGS